MNLLRHVVYEIIPKFNSVINIYLHTYICIEKEEEEDRKKNNHKKHFDNNELYTKELFKCSSSLPDHYNLCF